MYHKDYHKKSKNISKNEKNILAEQILEEAHFHFKPYKSTRKMSPIIELGKNYEQ